MSTVDRPDPPGPDLPGTPTATATPETAPDPAPDRAPDPPPETTPAAPLSSEERAELHRLRTELAALR
ncbi:hypothetical protein LWC33_34565, partial [Pseudonocardia sp. RS11V-5]|nr:hypothetical protein [Pseudonocardia terrae]